MAYGGSVRESSEPVAFHERSSIPTPKRRHSRETRNSNADQWFDDFNHHQRVTRNTDIHVDDDSSAYHPDSVPLDANKSEGTDVTNSEYSDDYQNIIHDQLVEIQNLKKAIRQYKPEASEGSRELRLFEVQMLNLPNTDKRRELEETLQDFVTGLSNTNELSRLNMTQYSSTGCLDSNSPSERSILSSQRASSSCPNFPVICPDQRLAAETVMASNRNFYDDPASRNAPNKKGLVEIWLNDLPRSGRYNRRKRRNDGSAVFYNSKEFVVDLLGEAISPTHDTTSDQQDEQNTHSQSTLMRQQSVAYSPTYHRPLRDVCCTHSFRSLRDSHRQCSLPLPKTGLTSTASNEAKRKFLWNHHRKQQAARCTLRPSGDSGVLLDDHFMICVTTRRLSSDSKLAPWIEVGSHSGWTTVPPRVSMQKPPRGGHEPVKIEYISSRLDKLAPERLPPLPMHLSSSITYSDSGESSRHDNAEDD